MTDENTPLPPEQTAAFQRWLAANHVRDLDHPDSHYDYRGAYLAGVGRGPGEQGHFPDTFKQHGHPTFSVESRYSAGPDDGGSWNGETFIPAKPRMTDQGPSFLPGQQPIRRPGDGLGRVSLPGVNDQSPPPAQTAPYGMLPGQRHVLPEQVDLDAPQGVGGAVGAPPAQAPQANGWKIYDADGTELADLSMDEATTHKHQESEVSRIGNALMSQATSPQEQVAAQRAMAFGLSQVGTSATADIKKDMVHRYDVDTNNALAMERQKLKSARNMGGKGGVPNGPSKADKFENSVDEFDSKLTEDIIKQETASTKLAALNAYENDIDRLEAQINAPNALSERTAVMGLLQTLSGKASTDIERQQITGAAGVFDQLANRLNLLNPGDAGLTANYKKLFAQNLRTIRGQIRARKTQLGKDAAERLANAPRFAKKDEETKRALRRYGRGAVTGDYSDDEPPGAAPPVPGKAQGNPQLKDPYGDL